MSIADRNEILKTLMLSVSERNALSTTISLTEDSIKDFFAAEWLNKIKKTVFVAQGKRIYRS